MQVISCLAALLICALPPAQEPAPGQNGPGPGGPHAGTLAEGLADSDTGSCLFASSSPRRGYLYPMSAFLNVDLAGRVGIGTTAQQARLHVLGGSVAVDGELVTTRSGAVVVNAVGSAATGSGGALSLLGGGGSPTVIAQADGPTAGTASSFELVDPGTGDAVRVLGQAITMSHSGRLDLEVAGALGARLEAFNSNGILDTPQVDLRNGSGKRTVSVSGSYTQGTGAVLLSDPAGTWRAELSAVSGANLTLYAADGANTVRLSGTSDVEAPRLQLASAENNVTVDMQADFEDSGAGRVTLGVDAVGETVFLDGGSAGTGPELLINHQSGTRAITMGTSSPEGGGILSLATIDGDEVLALTRSSDTASSWGGSGLLRMHSSAGTGPAVELGVSGNGPLPPHRGLLVSSGAGDPVLLVSDWLETGYLWFFSGSGTQESAVSGAGLALFGPLGGPGLFWNSETGSKAAVVATESFGARQLYVREGAECWFEDAGLATTRGGVARVDLDPLFLEVTAIGPDEPLRVFVTPHADSPLALEVDARGFTVRTDAERGAVPFSWVVQATRLGFERARLDPARAPAPEARATASTPAAREVPRRTAARHEPVGAPANGGVASRDRGAVDDPAAGAPSGPAMGPVGGEVADTIRNRAPGPAWLEASSVPALGCLYPISAELFVDTTGVVGIGTTSPDHRLTVENGDVLVEAGDFSIGLPGAEAVLVREGSDGLPTFELRNAAGTTALTIGESSLSPGVRTGLELVDLAAGLPLFRSAGSDGVELTDAYTGALAVRLTSDQLSAFNQDEVLTLQLAGGPGPVDAQLFDGDGLELVRIDTDPGAFGGTRLRLLNPSSSEELQIGRRLLSADGSNAEARIAVGDSIELSSSRAGGVADSGSLVLRDGAGASTLLLDGRAPTGGAELVLNDGLDDRLRVVGQGAFGAPSIEVLEPGGLVVARIDGESGAGESGSVVLNDNNGVRLAALEGDIGGGGVLSVFEAGSAELVRLDAALSAMILRNNQGIVRARFQDGMLELMNSAGNVTVSYDGSSGSKNGVVATRDHGARKLYAIEAPELWFEDSGHARLEAGSARIELEQIFEQTVTVSSEEPLLVFVTPTGPCAGLWALPDETGFTVHERGAGDSNATFDWRVLARRRGFEGQRMEPWRAADPRATSEREDS